MTDGPDREGPLVPPENGTETAENGQDGNARQNAAPSAGEVPPAQNARSSVPPQGAPNAQQNARQGNGYPPPPPNYGANGQYGYPPPQYAPPPQYVYPPQVQTPLSTLSILGFVFAFVMSLVGLILSIVAYSNAKREGDLHSKNFSQIGIILSAVFLGLGVVIGIIVGIAVSSALAGYWQYY